MSIISSLKDIKKGQTVIYNQEPCQVQEANFLRMQQRKPVMQSKLKGMISGKTYEYSFKQGENVETADLERRLANYLYRDGDNYVFMDNSTYDQIFLNRDILAHKIDFLTENMTVDLLYWQERLISVDVPIKADLKVVETEPGVRGDTAQGSVMKPAKLESGATIQVPIFVKIGDTVRVNTEKGEYVERVS